jgi:hypothetical protein
MKTKFKNKAEVVAEAYGAEFATGMFNIDNLFANVVKAARAQGYDFQITRGGIQLVEKV